MCSQKFRKKTNHLFLETKMTKYVLQLYIYTATFYGFHMLSKFVQSQCLRSDKFTQWLLLELWQCIKCLMLGQNIYQQQMASWKFSKGHVGEDIQSSNHLHVNSPQSLCQPTKMAKCIINTDDIWKTLDGFYIYFSGKWFVKIKLKKLYPHLWICEQFVARHWYKMAATPCSRHGLWLCKAIFKGSRNIDHFFLTYTIYVMEGISLIHRSSIDW